MKRSIIAIVALSLLFLSCRKESSTPQPENHLTKFEQLVFSNHKLDVFVEKMPATGYQKLFFKLSNNDGSANSNTTISLKAIMDMGNMQHSSPAVQPAWNADMKMYEGAVVFTMPSGDYHWYLNITIGNETKQVLVNVASTPTKLTGSFKATNGDAYVISLVPGKAFTPGINDFTILVNRKKSMMEFPAADGLTIQFNPEMPSMSHGSPNNTDPVNIGNGYYRGKVNFTMSGDWRLHFKVSLHDELLLDDASLDITF